MMMMMTMMMMMMISNDNDNSNYNDYRWWREWVTRRHGHRTIRRWGWRERRNARWCRLVTYCYRILRNDQLKAGYPVILLFPTKMDTSLHAANYQLHDFKVILSYLVSGLLCWKLLSLLIFFFIVFFRSWRSNMAIQKLVLLIITLFISPRKPLRLKTNFWTVYCSLFKPLSESIYKKMTSFFPY